MTTTACPACKTEMKVDLSRVPAGRAARVTCPSCKHQYPVSGTGAPETAAAPAPAAPAPAATPSLPAGTAEERAWLRRELEALRAELERQVTQNVLAALGVKSATKDGEEAVDPERRNALVCEPDPQFAQLLCGILAEFGFNPQVVSDMRSAWRALDREWGVVTLTESLPDEPEAGIKLQERLSRMPGAKRRRIFIVHVTNEVRSLDGGMAFVLNANVVLNRADAANAKEIVKKGMSDYERLYKPFHEAMEQLHA